jgi:hypothetical protein
MLGITAHQTDRFQRIDLALQASPLGGRIYDVSYIDTTSQDVETGDHLVEAFGIQLPKFLLHAALPDPRNHNQATKYMLRLGR